MYRLHSRRSAESRLHTVAIQIELRGDHSRRRGAVLWGANVTDKNKRDSRLGECRDTMGYGILCSCEKKNQSHQHQEERRIAQQPKWSLLIFSPISRDDVEILMFSTERSFSKSHRSGFFLYTISDVPKTEACLSHPKRPLHENCRSLAKEKKMRPPSSFQNQTNECHKDPKYGHCQDSAERNAIRKALGRRSEKTMGTLYICIHIVCMT